MAVRLLPDLGELAGLVFVLGCIFVVDAFVRGLFGTVSGALGWIPYVGKVISAPVDEIKQKITSALGTAEAKIDREIGQCFHRIASTVVFIIEFLIALPVLIFELGQLVCRAIRGNTATAQHAAAATATATAATAAAVHGIDRTRAADASAWGGIDTLSGRVGLIESEIGQGLDPTLEALRARTRELEDGFQRAWDLLRKHEEALGIGAISAATAVALEELGGSWIRCRGVGLLGRKLCGSNLGLLKGLLEGTLAALTIADLCELTKGLVAVADSAPVQDTLSAFTNGLEDLIGCQGVSRPAPLAIPEPSLAPLTGWAKLAPAGV